MSPKPCNAVALYPSILAWLNVTYGPGWSYDPHMHWWMLDAGDHGGWFHQVACSEHDDECDCAPRYELFRHGQYRLIHDSELPVYRNQARRMARWKRGQL